MFDPVPDALWPNAPLDAARRKRRAAPWPRQDALDISKGLGAQSRLTAERGPTCHANHRTRPARRLQPRHCAVPAGSVNEFVVNGVVEDVAPISLVPRPTKGVKHSRRTRHAPRQTQRPAAAKRWKPAPRLPYRSCLSIPAGRYFLPQFSTASVGRRFPPTTPSPHPRSMHPGSPAGCRLRCAPPHARRN